MNPLIFAAWLFAAGDMPPPAANTAPAKPAEPDVEIPVRCNGAVCLLPQAVLKELIEAHNAHVERIRELEAKVSTKDCRPPLKKERDT
jgi:hypothetical protein